jgi:signal transduction histidine kinase
MKQLLIVFFLVLGTFVTTAQNNPYWQEPTKAQADSLKFVLRVTKNDTLRMYIDRQLGLYYQEIKRAVALTFFEEQLTLAKKLNQKIWEAEALSRIAYSSSLLQNYSGAFKNLLMAREIASNASYERDLWNAKLFSGDGDPQRGRLTVLADIIMHQGLLNYFTGDFSKAMEYYKEVRKINESINDNALNKIQWLNWGESYIGMKLYDSAKIAFNRALQYSVESGYRKYEGLIYYDLGKIFETEMNFDEAKKMYHLSAGSSREQESPDYEGMAYQALADLTRITGAVDSSFMFSEKAVSIYLEMNDTLGLSAAYRALSSAFDARNQTDSAYYYLKRSIALEAGLNKAGKAKSFQSISFNEQIKLQDLEAQQLRTQSRTRTWTMISGIGVLLLISGILYRNNRRQKKDKANIEKAYEKLKSTQSQLIQSEKMASLGELTAGIAHEIQNPLNFVNNFSEINTELIEELKAELATGNQQEAILIAEDIKDNEQKINYHGKRADAIVKGMLQHSRASTGKKEPTDINALADEYLRLSYHGLRAKDKSFNANFKTDFDKTIGKIEVMPQDIGRVLLNLYNNAFYAVNEKKKVIDLEGFQNLQGLADYEPTVSVSTKKIGDKVKIKVSDNGNGIPQKVLDKIFQPFFTTKPTGQGTGLGLSLSYDIVKAHGGEIKVYTKDGDGSEFIIILPTTLTA